MAPLRRGTPPLLLRHIGVRAPALPLILQIALLVATAAVAPMPVAATAAIKPRVYVHCADIFDASATTKVDGAALLRFAGRLPFAAETPHRHVLVRNAVAQCGLVAPELRHSVGDTSAFRSSCRAAKRAIETQHMKAATAPPPRAVAAAISLAREALAAHPCAAQCPCALGGSPCAHPASGGSCMTKSDEDMPFHESESLSSSDPQVEPSASASPDAEPSPDTELGDSPLEPSPESQRYIMEQTPSPDWALVLGNVDEAEPTVAPILDDRLDMGIFAGLGNLELSKFDEEKDDAEATKPVIEEKVRREPVGQANNSGGSVQNSKRMTVPAIAGMSIAAVMAGAVLMLGALHHVAYQRRHADEIEQWRTAFRVVEH